jgi:hypothetical protein
VSIAIVIETGTKKAFASALDWPGWCRSAGTPDEALASLTAYRQRYEEVVDPSGLELTVTGKVDVVEVLEGDASTDFGAPGAIASAEREPATIAQVEKQTAILQACWDAFDRAVAEAAGARLRTGPRGGGRQVEAISTHVLEAEASYLRRIAMKPPGFDPRDGGAAALERAAALEGISRAVREGLPEEGPRGGVIWPVRYFIRRAAWHALDHAWEIQDRLS